MAAPITILFAVNWLCKNGCMARATALFIFYALKGIALRRLTLNGPTSPTKHPALLLATLIFALFLPHTSTYANSTHRCGSKLVSLDDDQYRVQSLCGVPVTKDPIGYSVRRDDYGFMHEVWVEEWTYGPTNGMYYFLRFEGGKLTRIKSSR